MTAGPACQPSHAAPGPRGSSPLPRGRHAPRRQRGLKRCQDSAARPDSRCPDTLRRARQRHLAAPPVSRPPRPCRSPPDSAPPRARRRRPDRPVSVRLCPKTPRPAVRARHRCRAAARAPPPPPCFPSPLPAPLHEHLCLLRAFPSPLPAPPHEHLRPPVFPRRQPPPTSAASLAKPPQRPSSTCTVPSPPTLAGKVLESQCGASSPAVSEPAVTVDAPLELGTGASSTGPRWPRPAQRAQTTPAWPWAAHALCTWAEPTLRAWAKRHCASGPSVVSPRGTQIEFSIF
jgi:hypothetical protein